MRCPLCQSRPAKRRCPGVGQTICAVCCGTKRLVEIRCPSDCGYLAASRQNPPAVERRQHEQDVLLMMPAVAELTDRQSRFFFLFQSANPYIVKLSILDDELALTVWFLFLLYMYVYPFIESKLS